MSGNNDQDVKRLTIPGGYGRSISMAKAHCICVRDIEGGQ